MYSKWLFCICVAACAYRSSGESETVPNVQLELVASKSVQIPDLSVDEKEKMENVQILDQPSEGKQNLEEGGEYGETRFPRSGRNTEQPVGEKEKHSEENAQISDTSSEGKQNLKEKSGEPIVSSSENEKKKEGNTGEVNPSANDSADSKNSKILEPDQKLTVEKKVSESDKKDRNAELEVNSVESSDTQKIDDSVQETTASSSVDFTTILAETSKKKCPISNDTEFSWLVKIIDRDARIQVCTGTLITDEDILVPASCFLENSTVPVADNFYDAPEQIYAIAGGGIDSDCMQIRNVTAIYPHKAYLTDVRGEHDYAYLKVNPEFDVDDDNIPDLRYLTSVLSSEGGLVDIHNRSPFCESPYFLDDGINARVSEDRHLMGMRIEECMARWNCSADFDGCLSFLHPASHGCLRSLAPRNCTAKDRGAPLVCSSIFFGFLDICDGELPLIFRGLNKAIKFLELEENHVQQPGYFGVGY